jgi:hypothetical protein
MNKHQHANHCRRRTPERPYRDRPFTPTSCGLTSNQLILLTAVVLVAIFNQSFFAQSLTIYGPSRSNLLALATLPLTLGLATCLMLGIVAVGRLTKPVLALALIIAALCAYFMDSFGVVISDEMLQNVAQTNTAEAFDLLNPRLLAYLACWGRSRPGFFPASPCVHAAGGPKSAPGSPSSPSAWPPWSPSVSASVTSMHRLSGSTSRSALMPIRPIRCIRYSSTSTCASLPPPQRRC